MNKKLSYVQVIVLGFATVILTGSVLLSLPIATVSGQHTSFVDALFTATSATCVTGLVAFDTATHWTLFGQLVILALIQVGGLGFVSFTAMFSMVLRKKIGLGRRELFQEALGSSQVGGIVRVIRLAILGSLFIEVVGALLLMVRFVPQFGARGIYMGIFHSISAFCNAGFDLMGSVLPFSSLSAYVGDVYVCGIIMTLIVVGGLGFFVWEDLLTHKFSWKHYRLHTKLVLSFTAFLILVPTVFFFIWEKGASMQGLDSPTAFLASLFQSVTCRTAGFNTIDLTMLTDQSSLLSSILMFIGGSPGSTAGGIKTTTMVVLLLAVVSIVRKQRSNTVFGRRLEDGLLVQAHSIAFVYSVAMFFAVSVLCGVDMIGLKEAIFEVASAIGTVGLSMGVTTTLSSVSKLMLSALMLFGRVGGLSMVMALAQPLKTAPVTLPLEKISVG